MNTLWFSLVLAVVLAVVVELIRGRRESSQWRERWQEFEARLGKTKCLQCAKLHERASVWCSDECERAFFNLSHGAAADRASTPSTGTSKPMDTRSEPGGPVGACDHPARTFVRHEWQKIVYRCDQCGREIHSID
jgi:hypothetical protein